MIILTVTAVTVQSASRDMFSTSGELFIIVLIREMGSMRSETSPEGLLFSFSSPVAAMIQRKVTASTVP